MNIHQIDPFSLERYGHNLTHLAMQGAFSPLIGYEVCIDRIFQTLLRIGKSSHKYNPLLLDLGTTNRWQIVIEVVRRMAGNEAPDSLLGRQIISLNYETLFAGSVEVLHPSMTKSSPELTSSKLEQVDPRFLKKIEQKEASKGLHTSLEEWSAPNVVLRRIQEIFLSVRQTEGQVILFIDNFHRLLGGEPTHYSVDALDLLKPVLARREVQIIGTSTLSQYQQYILYNAAIASRLQDITIKSDEELRKFTENHDKNA